MRRTKRENRAIKSLLFTDILQKRKDSCTCPYCGGKMILRPAGYIASKYKNQEYMVCTNYPVCDTYARVSRYEGSIKLVSTPANKELRLLRKEAHFWVDKLIETKIASNYTAAYAMLSQRLSTTNGARIHIGQCRELVCKEIIVACVDILTNNRHRFSKIDIWTKTGADNKDTKQKIYSLAK